MRLNKFLQAAGVASRRGADALIREGMVRVNGKVIREPWFHVDPGMDTVEIRGRRLSLPSGKHYFKLYKPRGVVSTLADPHAHRTLAEYIPPGLRLFPVGRLDRDSEGLILLTDDGTLAFRLTHPRFRIPKRYRVTLDRPLRGNDLERLRRGIQLDDGPFQPLSVRRRGKKGVEIVICEGRKREIRRALSRLGYRVERLLRTHIGPLGLGTLRPGELRPLSGKEVKLLKKAAGMALSDEETNGKARADLRRGPSTGASGPSAQAK